MEKSLLDLPDELLDLILCHTVDRPWTTDVKDFLSFTSTCRRLRKFVHDNKYWKTMALHRDPFASTSKKDFNWFEYCREIYLVRVIAPAELEQPVSRYDENYFCTVEGVTFSPKKLRLYIDERGNASLGDIQSPFNSTISSVETHSPSPSGPDFIRSEGGQFSIADPSSQYLGYLEFPLTLSKNCLGKNLWFKYGFYGYASATLFRFDQTFVDRYNLIPLFEKPDPISQ